MQALNAALEKPRAPAVAIVGGAKVSTKTAPLMSLLDRVRTLLIGGGMANTFLKADGYDALVAAQTGLLDALATAVASSIKEINP